jgi:hypothetical protein
MTTTDYVIDIALISLVLLQIRGRRLTPRFVVLPLVLVSWAGVEYLHGVPTAGNDLLLVTITATTGVVLGVLTGLATHIGTGADGYPVARAGVVAATLWILGVGCRFAFQMYASHGGGAAIDRFSAHHQITGNEAWVAALILMAFGEVLARTIVLALRAYVIVPAETRRAMMGSGAPIA